MTYQGKVLGGVVVFEGDERPADGTAVTVAVESSAAALVPTAGVTLAERLLALSGGIPAGTFPSDSSTNVDHYLYGLPKR